MRRRSLAIGLSFLLICSGFIPISVGFNVKVSKIQQPPNICNGNTLYVGGLGPSNYTTIQSAIDDASEGDTVYVFDDSSPYYENVVVDKSINLIGENKENTIIHGNNDTIVINISNDYINISGFKIRNGIYGIYIYSDYNTIYGNIISDNSDAIYLYDSNYNNIKSNLFSSNTRTTIGLLYSNCNTITDNNFLNNDGSGIHIHFSINNNITVNTISENSYYDGILLTGCSNHTITGNNISSNDWYGIWVYSSHNNTINFNSIYYNNWAGILFESNSRDNIITENTISSNGIGIWFSWFVFTPFGNKIYHNNFIDNMYNAHEERDNIWDDGKYGNYWSDYKEKYPFAMRSLLKPWMWNTPYEIEGGDNKDNCPLVNKWPDPRPRTITRITPSFSSFWLRFFDMFPILQGILFLIK